MAITKAFENTETKLKRLRQRSVENPGCEMRWVMPLFSAEGFRHWFRQLNGKKAVGIDGVTKEQYGNNLDSNISDLILRMKRFSYRPGAVREVLIPKGDGKFRPLGIGNLEDKMVQTGIAEVLEAIYEPQFYDFSYGFRPNRSCHMAIQALRDHLFKNPVSCVIDVDLKNFFGSIKHDVLVEFLRIRIKDESFLRYIVRTLKAGILREGEFVVTDEGTPQGSPASPILANIVAHYVIDDWFVQMATPVMRGQTKMVRYADDLVICCELESDADRILKGLKGRLAKYGLELNEEKTKVVKFNKRRFFYKGEKQGTFDFLGFTIYMGKTENKKFAIPKLQTSRKRMKIKLKTVNEWMKLNYHKVRMRPLWETFRRKLTGHMQYYGVSFNSLNISKFFRSATLIFFKWMNKRSQKRSLTWKQFYNFLKLYPLPKIKIYKKLF
jgi:group II intron reverse transcriptase/maturase